MQSGIWSLPFDLYPPISLKFLMMYQTMLDPIAKIWVISYSLNSLIKGDEVLAPAPDVAFKNPLFKIQPVNTYGKIRRTALLHLPACMRLMYSHILLQLNETRVRNLHSGNLARVFKSPISRKRSLQHGPLF